MQLRLLTIACLACAAVGCSTANEPADAQGKDPGSYRTGSRLPSYDPPGTAASREVSADDWNDARRTGGQQGNVK